MQQPHDCDRFVNKLALKQSVATGKASVVDIHRIAKSGFTTAAIIFSQLTKEKNHQSFRGTLPNRGGRFKAKKLRFDTNIYEAICAQIIPRFHKILKQKKHVTILTKKLAGSVQSPIRKRLIQISEKFLFTIRELQLQCMSCLSAMTEKMFIAMFHYKKTEYLC